MCSRPYMNLIKNHLRKIVLYYPYYLILPVYICIQLYQIRRDYLGEVWLIL